MFAEQQREYLDKGYTKIESFFSAEEVAKILEDVKQIELGAIGVASDNETYQFEKKNGETTKLLRRVENPHLYFDAIDSLVRSEKIVDLLRHFLGENIRLHNSKINFKPPSGAPVQWHQDWAFYPHTNDDFLTLGIFLDETSEKNGAMACLPGSHKGKVYDHRNVETGECCHAISRSNWDEALDPTEGELLTGPVGTVTLHHVRTLHGSGPNHSTIRRRFLLIGYAAADAWPLLGCGNYGDYESLMVSGRSTVFPRMVELPLTVPYPLSMYGDRIFESQRALTQKYY